MPAECRPLFQFLVVGCIVNIAASLLAGNHIRHLPLLHLYTIAESLLLLNFYRGILPGRNTRLLLAVAMPLFTLLCIANVIFLQSIMDFNSYARSLEAVMMIVCCMRWFLKKKPEEGEAQWPQNPLNWMNAGLLIYFSSGFFLFAFSNIVMNTGSPIVHRIAWNLHAGLVLIMYLLFSIGFYKCKG